MMKGHANANARALATLAVIEHSTAVRRYVARHIPNMQDAEDVTQETLEKFVRSANEKMMQENLLACLIQIAKWKIAEFRKRRAKESAHIDRSVDVRLVENIMVANGEFYLEGLEEQEERSQRLDRVLKAFDQLSPSLTVALTLHVSEGLSCPQIAKLLKMKEDAVRKNIERARAELQLPLQQD